MTNCLYKKMTKMCNKLNNVVLTFLLLNFLPISQQKPFIVDDTLEYCFYSFNGDKNKFVQTNSTILHVKIKEFQVSFTLCKAFHNSDICPHGLTACLKHFEDEQKIGLGNAFISDGNQLMTIYGHKCTKTQNYSLVINFNQEGLENLVPQPMEDNCTFNIAMKLPVYSSMCGTFISGKYIDLSPLARSFEVHTKTRNFSVTLCGRDPTCKQEDVNACEFTGSNMIPISLLSTLKPTYDGSKISFKGVTHKGSRKKFDKRFTVLLKCDWDKNEVRNGDLTYNEVSTQGKKYSFQLETSYGCLKISNPCVVKDKFLVYNLTELNAEPRVAWSATENSSRKSIFFIQMCGPADWKGKNESCKNTYAQVCENINGEDVNRGSVLSQLEVDNDAVVATIDKGTKCYDHYQEVYTHHKTIINFFCDSKDYGPKVVPHLNSSCEIYFHWRTSKACPKYDVTSCTHIKEANHFCKFSFDQNYYDLSSLTSTKVVTDKRRNLEFKFNVCGSVLDSDVPCSKDVSVVKKNLTQPNVKFRFTSLGKYSESIEMNDNLVLKFQTGEYCNGTEGDYRSEIHFECSSIEEKPILHKEEICYYEFLWKTPVACPYPLNDSHLEEAPCIFTDHINMKSFNFGIIKTVQFFSRDNITFDICSRSYKLCRLDSNECSSVELKNITAVFTRTVNKLEIVLDKNCHSSNDFNRFTLKFLCESIKNNHHFGEPKISNCSLTITYFTDVMCSLEDDSGNSSMIDLESSKEKISNEFQPVANAHKFEITETCPIKSPYTQREINRQNLPADFLKLNCPIVIFNNTFRFVKLTYSTHDKCPLIPSKNMSYDVYLTCSSTLNHPFSNNECHLLHYFHKLEYCDMFKNLEVESQDESDVLLIVGIVLAGAFFVSMLLILLVVRKKNIFVRGQHPFIEVYEKDTQL
ncbi:uncharacterized protein [Euwallacea similis]|uniref:uncharacterized protein isoform X2 n=1 Tax=Euwallacea similis TaxID=1736056 RepID=UPI003450A41F